jgi:hydroxylamine dehydrogenase
MRYLPAILFILLAVRPVFAEAPQPSDDTGVCIDCHREVHPGIVADWERSRHARTLPGEALGKPELERRVSASSVPDRLRGSTVGCAECHTLNSETHTDAFDHNGYTVHVVVSPADCAVCHPDERGQYRENIMSRAYGNLMDNPVYRDLASTINGVPVYDAAANEASLEPPDRAAEAASCLFCHGTRLRVDGFSSRETVHGEMTFPVISGWPNQGVGRVNPDGTLGACSACHARHEFAIETARKPHTCSQCHKGPDVPGYKVYEVSKHGNIYASSKKTWSFDPVPWVPGRDFTAPTCAACHMSLCTTEDGRVISERTHRVNDRLAWRLFGVYAHPHPESPDTSTLENRAGLPLPVELDGRPAPAGLIDGEEQVRRNGRMKGVCASCHGRGWVENQFDRLDRTIRTTNDSTLAATQILSRAWELGLARGLDRGDSPFNEAIEQKWSEHWLFYANSARYAAAMMGADYGVFDNGRWYMAKNIQEMIDWLRTAERVSDGAEK